jgi:hypothetical protein|tara:strand:+ start:90 stop:854 length:765 start_codon:yes stop_codon:yes gene_type:complete
MAIKLKDILRDLFEVSTNIGGYSADEGEPDTGFIHGGKKRKLGKLEGKPEPWYESGGYTQLDFPEADHMRGKGVKPEFEVTKIIKERILKEGKTVSIFDFDDTLAKTDSWVYVKSAGGMEKQLDPAEFAVYTPKKGEEFDFRDFDRKLRNPRIIKKNVDLLKKQLKKGGRKVTILTARRLGAPINHFFKTLGIQPYVVPLGSADPKKKADYIEAEINKGYSTVYFMDDSPKNIRAVDKLKKKYPHVRLVTKLVK